MVRYLWIKLLAQHRVLPPTSKYFKFISVTHPLPHFPCVLLCYQLMFKDKEQTFTSAAKQAKEQAPQSKKKQKNVYT
jgi:hypothetical protein